MYRYNMAFVFAFTLWDMASAQKVCRPKNCYDFKCYGVSKATDGPHNIYPSTPQLTSLQVSCDQETDGGGWIMYQRRVDGTVNFTKYWEEYKYMFGEHGDNTTELWLGNENVTKCCKVTAARSGNCELKRTPSMGRVVGWWLPIFG